MTLYITRQTKTITMKTNQIIEEMNLMYQWTPRTKKQYNVALNTYTDYHRMSIEELIQEAEEDEETINKVSKRRIKKRLLTYTLHLQNDKHFKPNSIKAYLSKISKIYKYHEIDLPELPRITTRNQETFDDIPTHKEIQTAIINSRPKMKSLITFIASSGLRRSDVSNLTINDFITATREYHQDKYDTLQEILDKLNPEQEVIIPTWKLCDQKTGITHITYNSNEATYYMKQMLQERIRRGEKLDKDSLLYGIQAQTITHNFKKINNLLGYPIKDKRGYFHPHALRKYFATTLISNDVDYLATEFLLGHQLSGSSRSYYFANPDRLRNKYMRVMDNLNFTMNINYLDINTREREEFLQMKEDYKEVKEELKTFKEYIIQKQKLDDLAKKYGLEE